MKVAIELPPAQAAQLEAEAIRLGVPVEELARAAVTDLLAAPDAIFQATAERVLAKNNELYRRLA
ncbi:MAG: DNA-binding protein [Cyanobacteria bacterium]|nr:DNA-binding protein [Cyanobacteriota bacterium]